MNIKRRLIKNYVNFRGKSLWGRKIVLIESDDWGSIRMPSREVYNKFRKAGINVDEVYFDKYDSLESASDLVELFTVLSSVKDSTGRNAIIAPYTLVANPDYSSIRANNKECYAYESVLDTAKNAGELDYMKCLYPDFESFKKDNLFHPISKAICQALITLSFKGNFEEVTYDELQKDKSERGTGKMGSSNK